VSAFLSGLLCGAFLSGLLCGAACAGWFYGLVARKPGLIASSLDVAQAVKRAERRRR
jgi:hypothetical protein